MICVLNEWQWIAWIFLNHANDSKQFMRFICCFLPNFSILFDSHDYLFFKWIFMWLIFRKCIFDSNIYIFVNHFEFIWIDSYHIFDSRFEFIWIMFSKWFTKHGKWIKMWVISWKNWMNHEFFWIMFSKNKKLENIQIN